MARSDIEIRRYRPGDEADLAGLFMRCFGRAMSPEFWLWKIRSDDPGYENAWIVTANGRVVAQYVGIPVTAIALGAERPAIVILDTMVDPAMRRQGILGRMGRHAHEYWQAAGVDFGIGLPNEQWGTRAALLGWEPLFPLRWLVRVLRPEAILARRASLPALARFRSIGTAWRSLHGRRHIDPDISVRHLSIADGMLDAVAEAAAPAGISLERGSQWVSRRYLTCPGIDYRVILAERQGAPAGYLVYRIRGGERLQFVVTEIVAAAGASRVSAALLARVEQLAIDAGAEALQALAVPGSRHEQEFRSNGYLPRRAAFGLQFVPFNERYASMRGVDDWHFMGGDFDVV